MTGLDVLFGAFGLLTAAAGALAVTSRRVVHAALWLVVALGGLGGVYLVLGAEVVALVQVLVYVGAVVVLVLFALMLTRAPTGASQDVDAPAAGRAGALVVAVATGTLVAGTLLSSDAGTFARDGGRGQAQTVGEVLFAWWVLPFELLSVLLLAALVAALAISRRREEDT